MLLLKALPIISFNYECLLSQCLIKRQKSINIITAEDKEKLRKRFAIGSPDFKSVLIGGSIPKEDKSTNRTHYVSRVKRILTNEIKKYSMIRLPYNLKNRHRGLSRIEEF